MPKKVLEKFLRDLTRDIKANYHAGDRYLTLDEICRKFSVCKKTAHNAVKKLALRGMVKASPRRGIIITSLEEKINLSDKKMLMLSNLHHRRSADAFFSGAKELADSRDIAIAFMENPLEDTRSLSFGDFLLEQNVDGICAVSFADAALGFYRAMREGLDIVADYHMDDLPILPVIESDSRRHGLEAGKALNAKGFGDIVVAGFGDAACNRIRFEALLSQIDKEKTEVRYLEISQPNALFLLDRFLYSYGEKCAVVSIEYRTNELIAAQFVQHRIRKAPINLFAYDSYDDTYDHKGLPPVPTFAPSFKQLGAALARRLINKWETGRFTEPMLELI
jgi:DNA-binding LacI/PurR family transcriptional regulator